MLASSRPATSHLGSQLVAKQDVYVTMVGPRAHLAPTLTHAPTPPPAPNS